jgi:HK97 family phage portal protein
LFRGAATSIDPIHPRDPALAKLFGLGTGTFSGVDVNHDKVLALPAIMRGVSIISNGMAKLPFYVFREQDDGHDWDKSHPSWTVVSRKPHRDITDGTFRQTLNAWAMLWGNGYAYIDRPNWPRGPLQLIPMLPDRTWPYRVTESGEVSADADSSGMLRYATHVGGEVRTLDASEVLHIRGIGPNPYVGYNIVDLLRETFGGAIASQEFGHRFFGQGANPAGWVEMGGSMDEEAEERFMKSMSKAITGLGKTHKIALLEEGAKFHKWSVDPDAAQFLETKSLDIRLLAMAIGIKVHKLIDGANSSYSSLEQANQEHKDDDLMPWVCRWREEMEDKLLTEKQKESGSHSIDIDDEAMQWVPFRERASGVVELYNNGLIDKDEGRRKVNFGPSKVDRAKDFKTPANIVFEDDEPEAMTVAPMPPAPDEPEDDARLLSVSLAYMDRMAVRLSKDAQTKSKSAEAFDKWLTALSAESGPLPLQPSIDQLYAYVQTESKNCLLSTVTDAELAEAVGAASITFTDQAASIVESNLS